MASHFYSAFGLSLCADRPLPGLVARPASDADVRVSLGTLPPDWPRVRAEEADAPPWYTSPAEAPAVPPALTVWRPDAGRYYHLRYADATEFVIDRTGTQVWAAWPRAATLADTATYLLGPVLGLV